MGFKSFICRIGAALGTLSTLHAGCGYDGLWDIEFGYRHDNLFWSIAAQDKYPNIFAKIDWPDIHIAQFSTRYILSGWDSIYLRAEGVFGFILQASNTYAVYLADNMTDPFSIEKACRSGDKCYGAKVGLGAHILKMHGPFDLAILAGYSMQGLRLRWRDPKLVFSLLDFPGPVDNLVAKYRPKWNSGFAAIDGTLRYRTCLLFSASYELHWGTYRAHGVWNWTIPPEEAKLFGKMFYRAQWKDCSTAWGHVFSGSITYNTSENWYLGLFANAQYFRSRACDFDPYTWDDNSNPNLIYVVTFPNNTDNLNPVRWISYSVSVAIECQF